MSDIKCGQPGYKGPKCKTEDYARCDDVAEGSKFNQLVYVNRGLSALASGETKKNHGVNLHQVNMQSQKDSFWLVNNEASGICWNPQGKKQDWYLYELPKQSASSKSHQAKEKPRAKGFLDDPLGWMGDFFDDTIKGYQKKVAKIKKEGANVENLAENFWKEATGVLGAIVFITTIKLIRSAKKKKMMAEAVKDGRVSDDWELGRREPVSRPEPTLGSQRFADETPLPLVTKTPPRGISQVAPTVADTIEEPVFDLDRPSPPPEEPSASQPPAEERSPIGLGLEDSAQAMPGQEKPTLAVDYSAQTAAIQGQNGQPEVSQGSRPTVGFQSEPSALPPKATPAEMANTGKWKLDPAVLGEPELIIAETLHDFDPPDSLTFEDLEAQGFDLGEEGMKLPPLRNYEKEFEIRMPEKTLKRVAIIAHDEIFHRLEIDDYDKVLDNLVVLSFEKAAKNGEKVVELDHVVEAAMQFLDVEGEQAKAEFRAEVKEDLKVCKVWINRKGYETTAWNSKHASNGNGHSGSHSTNGVSSSNVRETSSSAGVRVGMPGDEPSIAGFKNTPEGGIEVPEHLRQSLGKGATIGGGKDASTTMATTQMTPEMMARALDATATVNRYPNFPPFKSLDYWKLARQAMGEYISRAPALSRVYRTPEAVTELKIAFTTVLNDVVESVAVKFFNRKEGVTYEGATAAAQKAQSITNGSAKVFIIPGIDQIPSVTDGYNELEVENMVNRAMDEDPELKGLQPFERAEYRDAVITAMKEIPGFQAEYVKDYKMAPEGVRVAVELVLEKGVKGLKGSGASALEKVEMTKDGTKAEEVFSFDDMFTDEEKRELFDPIEAGKKK